MIVLDIVVIPHHEILATETHLQLVVIVTLQNNTPILFTMMNPNSQLLGYGNIHASIDVATVASGENMAKNHESATQFSASRLRQHPHLTRRYNSGLRRKHWKKT